LSTTGGSAYKLLAYLEEHKNSKHILGAIPIDEYMQYFFKISMHEFGNDVDTFVQSSASGIVCTLCSFRSMFQTEGAEYDSVFQMLIRMIESPVNLTVFVNAVCGVAQTLLHTFQTPDQMNAVQSALNGGIWALFFDMLRNEHSLLHENKTAQIAATIALMYLCQHAEALPPKAVHVIENILAPEWKHIHLFAVACVW
jgi:hypothetical protein